MAKEVENLLKQLPNIVAEEQPESLQPMRSISHQIDLMQGGTLLNKDSYKLTPQQNAEISRQVQELLDK